jgi:hypothetical protein
VEAKEGYISDFYKNRQSPQNQGSASKIYHEAHFGTGEELNSGESSGPTGKYMNKAPSKKFF